MPNQKPIRRNHLISPFGVGALVDFPGDESLMTAGLDEWPDANAECPHDWLIREERLQARLFVSHFRLPPDYREQGLDNKLAHKHVPFVRFPRWHYCPRRGAMEKLPLFGSRQRCPCRPGLECASLPKRQRPWLIPSRLVAVCPQGHIEDFPFMRWIHKGGGIDETHKLRLLAGRSTTSLSGIRVRCSCGKSEALKNIFDFDSNTGGALHRIRYDCAGGTPWLGASGQKGQCGEYLRVVQRGASNVYFPLTVSSIYLPLWGKENSKAINRIIENPELWPLLASEPNNCEVIAAIAKSRHVDDIALKEAVQRKLEGMADSISNGQLSEEAFRRQEYEALRSRRGGTSTDLMVEVREASQYGLEFTGIIDKICQVKKLRETRVLAGFSRLFPVEDSWSTSVLPLSKKKDLNWLPATVVYGEGIFFEFDFYNFNRWLETSKVRERVLVLKTGYNRQRLERGLNEKEVTPKYVFLHTFAHALITQLSFDCGYGSAALRERIYCNIDEADMPMQGVLIYTSSGDSEGTLGGLVRQGEPDRMGGVIRQAIHRLKWCSSDPVCMESEGQGSDNANLAACHGCTLLPETSCETGNRLLDRGLIVGTTRDPEIGFFSRLG